MRVAPTIARMAVLAILYYLATRVGLSLSVYDGTISPVWPATGLALAGLLLFGVELWPAIALTALVTTRMGGYTWPATLAVAVATTLEAVLPTVLLRRFGFRPGLDRFEDVVRFTVIAGVLAPALTATIGGLSLQLSGVIPLHEIGRVWLIWFFGDMTGAVVVAPLLLTWLSPPPPTPPAGKPVEALLLVAALGIACVFAFGVAEPLLLPVFPLGIWAALRFGPRGSAALSAAVFATAVGFTFLGVGPFLLQSATHSLLFLQSFELSFALTGLLLAASTSERLESQAARRESERAVRVLSEASPLATVALDLEDRVLEWSPSAERVFGWTAREVLGQPLPIIAEQHREEYVHLRGQRQRGEIVESREVLRLRKDRTLVDLLVNSWPLRDAEGRVRGSMIVYHDITEQKEAVRLQRAIYRISEAAHTAPSLQALFSELHAIVGDLMPARNFYIALHDPATDTLSFPYFVDEKDPTPAPRRLGKGLTEYVLRSGQALLDRPGVLEELVRRGEVQSIGAASADWLGVPLKIGDRTIGVLTAQSYDAGVRYTERDRDILQFVSTQVAMAIDRKQAQEALRASEAELRALFAAMHDVILVLDADGRYLKIAPTNPGLLYRPTEQLLGRTLHEIFPSPQSEELHAIVRRALATRATVQAEYALDINGRQIWFLATVTPLAEDTVVWVARDVTEARLATETLAESEERYRVLYNRSPVMAHSIDRNDRIVAVSDYWLSTLGYYREEVIGRKASEFLTPESARYAEEVVRPAFLRDGQCTNVEYQMTTKRGDLIDVLLSAISERDDDGMVLRSLAILTDVTERKRIARQLEESQDRFERFVATTNDVLWDWDLSTQVIWWAPTLKHLLGFAPEEFQNDTWTRNLDPEDRQRIWNGLRAAIDGSGKAWSEEYRIRCQDGHWTHILDRATILRDADGKAVRMIGAMMDISDRKEAAEALRSSEEQLRQAMKMEAVGRLAGGVAHDFNNLLTAVLGHADLALSLAQPGHPLHDDIREIKAAALRAAALTQQLLAFSRKQVLERKVVDLNAVVAGTVRMLRRTIGADIELLTVLAPDLGRVRVDPVQLEQVLLNLAVNARDAMPQGGTLTIETLNAESPAGNLVRLRVTDTGVGMSEEVLGHIFEPFFTTKELGKGTGLGLATAYGIVKQSGGQISVNSGRDSGTTFLIDLPRAAGEAELVETPTPDRLSRGSETVLVVEDEDAVRSLARRVLEDRGYRVLTAAHAGEALTLSRGLDARIDLLLTDVIMPGASGPKLAEQLVIERPGLRVAYMSGYAATAIEQRLLLDGNAPFIQKPFTPDSLARRVRDVLDAAEVAGRAANG